MVRLSSDHWVCLFVHGEFPTLWPFGENLRTPLRSQRFFLSVLFFWHFSGGGSKVGSKIYLLPIYARAVEVFPSDQLLGSLLSCFWVVSYVWTGESLEGSAPLLRVPLMVQCVQHFSDKTDFWLQAAYWEVCYLTHFLLVSWWIRLRGVISPPFERILGVSVFHHVMWGGED